MCVGVCGGGDYSIYIYISKLRSSSSELSSKLRNKKLSSKKFDNKILKVKKVL